ncbi:thymidylate kinase, partial [Escherichia coli]|nr:thymidylate kinase [Escherichia coli]
LDYQEDKRYTLEEAEAIPELAPVVQRLKARIEEYEERRAHD